MKKIRFAVVGYGNRGRSMTRNVLFSFPEIEVVAVCDHYADRTEQAVAEVREKYGKTPISSTNHLDVLRSDAVDAVYVASSWETHVEVAIDALRLGIPVALEVGGAYSLDSLWRMVREQERTATPLMLMENCCFGKSELLATALVRRGLLGEIVHCHGAYAHYLVEEIAGGERNRHYRLRNYLARNCENYPTHELGPIAKLLGINRGNRMVSLVSVSSKAVGMEDYVSQNAEQYPELVGKRFRQGDIVNTIITCADGATISLRLDTTLPRSYAREFTVHGTRGLYEQNTHTVYFSGEPELFDTQKYYRENLGNAARFEAEYLPTVWREMTEERLRTGHGGIDSIEFRVFLDCLIENRPMPIDVYDAAAWMAITTISEASIAAGGMPQAIPDFTSGAWTYRRLEDVLPL
ncbi:MAG: Gfo/Idh/MocA family oxidoreductase [Ruminococcaceae bacterium]|nr:Gfo/Idh/MocA family oxidoreductase [Oscillospiraceae bacterium]